MPDEPALPKVTLFTRPHCHLCHAVHYVIARVAADTPLQLEVIDIDAPGQEHWRTLYTHDIPVVHIDGREHARHHLDERTLRAALTGRTSKT
jgi:zinc finger CCHC domain-containing protein 8